MGHSEPLGEAPPISRQDFHRGGTSPLLFSFLTLPVYRRSFSQRFRLPYPWTTKKWWVKQIFHYPWLGQPWTAAVSSSLSHNKQQKMLLQYFDFIGLRANWLHTCKIVAIVSRSSPFTVCFCGYCFCSMFPLFSLLLIAKRDKKSVLYMWCKCLFK